MKSDYHLRLITKNEASPLLRSYHYLSNISKGFKSGINYGCYHGDTLVGVCIYTGFPVPELVVGAFGIERSAQEGFYELSRLVLHPDHQKSEHNLASWFVSKTLKLLRKTNNVRAVLSYADSDYHSGIIYRACNFVYYGLSAPKKDYWFNTDGVWVKHSRGKLKGVIGEWRTRSQKHRYMLIYDKNLVCKWVTPN